MSQENPTFSSEALGSATKALLERGLGNVTAVQAKPVPEEKFTLKDFVEHTSSE